MDNKGKIAGLLKKMRNERGLSVDAVCESLERSFSLKISSKTLYGYENGASMPNVSLFLALCTIYGVRDPYRELGYIQVPVATADSEWSHDQYNEFFNASLREKIYLLFKFGVPSFDGYEKELEASLPSDSVAASFDRLYNAFMKLDEPEQDTALFLVDELAKKRHPNITYSELRLIKYYRGLDPNDALRLSLNRNAGIEEDCRLEELSFDERKTS